MESRWVGLWLAIRLCNWSWRRMRTSFSFSVFLSVLDLRYLTQDMRSRPCSFNGVYQPSLLDRDTFPTGKVFLLSYFYDGLRPLLPPDTKLTVTTFAEPAQDICLGR